MKRILSDYKKEWDEEINPVILYYRAILHNTENPKDERQQAADFINSINYCQRYYRKTCVPIFSRLLEIWKIGGRNVQKYAGPYWKLLGHDIEFILHNENEVNFIYALNLYVNQDENNR